MAGSVYAREWVGRGPSGRKITKTAFGFTIVKDGRRIRRHDASWTREDAARALLAAEAGIEPQDTKVASEPGMTLGAAVARFLDVKAKKRSLRDDRHRLARLEAALGSQTPLASITASRIAEYKAARLRATITRDGVPEPISPSTLNRELAALRTLLRLAHDEWEALDRVPRIKLEREAQGRLRYLEDDERARLEVACSKSRNRDLAGIVTVALETGLRKGELLGLTWDRVDMSRGVLRLEVTKSGRRREVPMRQAVYDVLAAWPGEHVGRVFPKVDIRKAFETAVAAAQLDGFRFHDLRHSFASTFMMAGGTLQTLRLILGHASLTMTLRYAHLSPDHLRGEMERTAKPSKKSHESLTAQDAARVLLATVPQVPVMIDAPVAQTG